MATGVGRRFPSPFEVAVPDACDGWEELFPDRLLFSRDRLGFDEGRFWFQDSFHYAEPYHPFDVVHLDLTVIGFNQASARMFVVPGALGAELRILNGYVYLSANSVDDEAVLARRAALFTSRGGFYYEHWGELDRRWREKVEAEIRDLEALAVPELPQFEDERLVAESRGFGSAHALLVAYDRLLESFDRVSHYHFELVNLGYGAYLQLYELCREAFPEISDQTVSKMVAGIDVVALRPDEELRRLARLARELGVGGAVSDAGGEEQLRAALAGSEAGGRWLADFDATKNPWFNFSCGNGLNHHHRSWIDDTTLPLAMIGSYVERLDAGEDISRPLETVVAERNRVADEYRSLLPDGTRPAFDERLELARTVFPHIEDHNFYVDHWYHTLFWNKVREFGALLAGHDFLSEHEDVFYLRPDEVRTALEELRLWWSSGAGVARGPRHWPPIVERRKSIYEAMRDWRPPPALGPVPDAVTDPVMIMHWGITTARVEEWLESSTVSEGRVLTGIAGSPGVTEGTARVVLRVEQMGELEDGEILVAPSTSTSWTPVFGRIAAAVTDAGGVMCHAAIVAREYRLPAVLGTGSATKQIKTGDRLRVDGSTGVVTILG